MGAKQTITVTTVKRTRTRKKKQQPQKRSQPTSLNHVSGLRRCPTCGRYL